MTSTFSSWPGLTPRRELVKASTVSLPPISTSVFSPLIGWASTGCGSATASGAVVAGSSGGCGLNLALVADLGPIAVLKRAVFLDRLDGGAGIAQVHKLVLELLLSDFDGGLVDLDVFVAVDGEGGKDFEDGLGVERTFVFESQLSDFGLADGTKVPAHRPPC